MSRTRHKYTQKEDEHLVEYLAIQAIGFQATRGNQLYKHLTENLQRWPWAEARTWQSWRDRYVKNQEAFNISIKRYRKKVAMERKDAVVDLGKRRRDEDGGATSKKPKLVDRDEVHGDKEGMKDEVTSKPLPPPTVASQPAAKQVVTPRRVQGQDGAGEQTTIPKEASKAKASTVKAPVSLFTQVSDDESDSQGTPGPDDREQTTTPKEALKAKASTSKAPVSLFTQVSDEESDSQGTPGPDDYRGEIFDDPQEQINEEVVDALLDVESDHDLTDVSEVEELLTPSHSKIAVISTTESNIPPSSQNGHRLYPDISQLPSPHLHYEKGPPPSTSSSSGDKPIPNSEAKPNHPPTVNKRLRKRRTSPDSGFFESPASSSRAPSPQRVRQPPRLIEGPFGGHRLAGASKGGGPSSDSDSDSDSGHTETWPPVRGKAKRRLTAMEKGKMKATDVLMEEAAPLKVDSTTVEHVKQGLEGIPSMLRPQQGVTNKRVDLSSEPEDLKKGKAAAVPSPPPKDSQRMVIVLPKEHPFDVPPPYGQPPSRHAVSRHNSVEKTTSSLPPPPLKGLHFPSVPPNVGSSRVRSSAAPSDNDDEIVSKLLSEDDPFIVPPTLGERPVPFLDLRSIAKKPTQRRYTLAAPPPPHIDLRKEAFKRASRKSLPGTSISAPVPTKDPMSELGKSLVRSWTKRFGLPEESVKKVWQEELSIESTEKRLQRARREHEKSTTPTGRAKPKFVPKMDIDVLPDDADIDGYEPPYSTRARRFAKLSKQGRVKEALDRDRRRASENGVKHESPLKRTSPMWGKAEDELLRTVNAQNASELLELEKKVGYAFMLEKVRDVALLNLV
ncbi:hypothetical protein EDD18DRAFT_1356745 [Armillaria luteobubalina]|uniref:TERF2-interacting telomeric protein 1 Myb domain-containing protein n=1 Tax=Armillaria luteobubalina TaxID=153913 RepID=A0AA39PZ94_9AGAR|nr:hypothetical protein EDD18DRAFT_1356745 [Armillaria luteobubalina]